VSNLIIKIGGTCRNIQVPGGVVFGEFFLNKKVPKKMQKLFCGRGILKVV
jgi:hypothetical protein